MPKWNERSAAVLFQSNRSGEQAGIQVKYNGRSTEFAPHRQQLNRKSRSRKRNISSSKS